MPKIIDSIGKVYNISWDGKSPNATGNVHIICPICAHKRKSVAHQKEEKLGINVTKDPKPWRCNHCGEAGFVDRVGKKEDSKAKIRPLSKKIDFLEVSDKLTKWFWEERKISIKTLRDFDISISEESMKIHRAPDDFSSSIGTYKVRRAINFKYIFNGMLVNIKFRDNWKNFKFISGASLIPFNLDAIKGSKKCVIVEGEIDVLSYHEAGIDYVISVPNGATITPKEKEIYEKTGKFEIISNINLTYLDPVINDLEHIETFYLATDDDAPGI
jgi:twinkle protein